MSEDYTPTAISPDVLAVIRAQYLVECDEHLVEFENGLLEIQKGTTDWEVFNTIFRAAHSIKGGAASFGMSRLVQFSHKLEATLADFRSRHCFPDSTLVAALLQAVDVLADLVHEAGENGTVAEDRVLSASQDIANTLKVSSDGQASEADPFADLNFVPEAVSFDALDAETRQRWIIDFRPNRAFYETANEPLVMLRELQNLGEMEIELDTSAVTPLTDLDAAEPQLAWRLSLFTRHVESEIRRVFEFVEGLCDLCIRLEAPKPPPPPPGERTEPGSIPQPTLKENSTATYAPTIRVDLEKVDRLINLVSEQVISEATLAERILNAQIASAHAASIASALDDLMHTTRDLQEYVMSVRAQPVKLLFQRMPRLVREIEAQTGKSVHLVVHGEETEVDRALIEGLTDALTHMVRNAIDHGVETPQKRMTAGKPAQGVIRLSAAHRAGRVVIEVADDGEGINLGKVRARAIQLGMIAPTDDLSDDDLYNLVFEPGFSTVDKVTNLSGRGVGMDVVRRNVQDLGGRIAVTSTPGIGATFTLSLPLTLAVMDGMIAMVCGQWLVIPMPAILETIQVKASDIHMLGTRTTLLTVHDKRIPLVDLGVLLGYGAPRDLQSLEVALLVEDEAGEQIALLVDDIPEQRQFVIKSLEKNHRRVSGAAAATILGSGEVALILDVNSIIALRKSKPLTEMGMAANA